MKEIIYYWNVIEKRVSIKKIDMRKSNMKEVNYG